MHKYRRIRRKRHRTVSEQREHALLVAEPALIAQLLVRRLRRRRRWCGARSARRPPLLLARQRQHLHVSPGGAQRQQRRRVPLLSVRAQRLVLAALSRGRHRCRLGCARRHRLRHDPGEHAGDGAEGCAGDAGQQVGQATQRRVVARACSGVREQAAGRTRPRQQPAQRRPQHRSDAWGPRGVASAWRGAKAQRPRRRSAPQATERKLKAQAEFVASVTSPITAFIAPSVPFARPPSSLHAHAAP